MEYSLARNWWILALRGALAVLFGVLAFLWPMMAWAVVVAFFAAYVLIDGCFAIAAAVTGHSQGRQWWALVLEGVLGISAGVLTVFWPEVTGLALLLLIAYWAIVTGVFEVVAAIRLRKYIEGEWALALSGVLSVLFGALLVAMPVEGALAVAWLIAAYWIAFGLLLLVLAFRLRSLARHAPSPRRGDGVSEGGGSPRRGLGPQVAWRGNSRQAACGRTGTPARRDGTMTRLAERPDGSSPEDVAKKGLRAITLHEGVIRRALVAELEAYHSPDRRVSSYYLKLGAQPGADLDVPRVTLKNAVAQARERIDQLDVGHAVPQALRRDGELVRELATTVIGERHTHALACFVDSGGGYGRALRLPWPVRDRVFFEDRFVLWPLRQVLEQADRYGIIVTDKEVARFFRFYLDAIEEEFAMLGTANFDIRSFYLNFELNLLSYDADLNGLLRFYQMRCIAESQELDLAAWRRRGALRQWGAQFAKLLSPLLRYRVAGIGEPERRGVSPPVCASTG